MVEYQKIKQKLQWILHYVPIAKIVIGTGYCGNTEVRFPAFMLCVCVCVCVRARTRVRGGCSVMSDFVTPWTVAHQALLSMGFSRPRILEGVAISFSKASSWPRDRTLVSSIAGRRFTIWATREAFYGSFNVGLIWLWSQERFVREVSMKWGSGRNYIVKKSLKRK